MAYEADTLWGAGLLCESKVRPGYGTTGERRQEFPPLHDCPLGQQTLSQIMADFAGGTTGAIFALRLRRMSALGHSRTFAAHKPMSAKCQ